MPFLLQPSNRPPKRPQNQNQLAKTKALQETDDTDAAINPSYSKEKNDWNIELASNISESELPSSDVDDVAENKDVILTAPDGTELNQISPGDYSSGRFSQQNILKKAFEPTPYVVSLQRKPNRSFLFT